MQQLIGGATRSPYQAKIVEDYHWVEVELALQLDSFRQRGHISMGDVSLRTAAALDFAYAAVNLPQKLNERGRRILFGRLRDGLNNGFAGLFLEIDTPDDDQYRPAYRDAGFLGATAAGDSPVRLAQEGISPVAPTAASPRVRARYR